MGTRGSSPRRLPSPRTNSGPLQEKGVKRKDGNSVGKEVSTRRNQQHRERKSNRETAHLRGKEREGERESSETKCVYVVERARVFFFSSVSRRPRFYIRTRSRPRFLRRSRPNRGETDSTSCVARCLPSVSPDRLHRCRFHRCSSYQPRRRRTFAQSACGKSCCS